MENNLGNVVLFPKMRNDLEKESLEALKQKKYPEALSKLNQLISYKINSHEIIVGKLICLMELDKNEEAQNLCEELMESRTEHYYEYVHIYLTILFQTNQYKRLMDQVENELDNQSIPSVVKDQFEQLYMMSKEMDSDIKTEKSTEFIAELSEAVDEENHIRQWQLIQNLCKMERTPTREIFSYLIDDSVHPVTKTAIFHWLQDQEISEKVTIHKLDLKINIKPIDIKNIRDHATFKQILLLIFDLEQENPTLFILLEQLLFRYAYVRYPILPQKENEITSIAEALKIIGEQYLHNETEQQKKVSESIKKFVDEIRLYDTLYLGIIEE